MASATATKMSVTEKHRTVGLWIMHTQGKCELYARSSQTTFRSLVNTPVKGPKFSVMKNIMGACMIAAQSARRISVADSTLKRKNPMSRSRRPTMKLRAG
jgi:hypothetical protein